ncbi:cation-translocating P-type ATPase [Arthrobacter sp. CG_A4]|uniref:cation-translocating P-type ATPase n=1 Tax=Arthrobacter sp. CG_A4 TaxID=3071706 RepID=UPI002E00DC73|nr:Ca2+-transporting ATPase [Arthrobacter sp. CG_A4]
MSTVTEHSSADWHGREVTAVTAELGTNATVGLDEQVAIGRLGEFGYNELEERAGRSVWKILWEQVSSILIVILVVAAGLAAALGKAIDASAILAIVVLFVVLGVVQEYRAQKAIAALKQMAAPLVRVVRDGQVRELSARELVPGDLVRLETGSVIPADVRIVESVNLRTQEAALTGESEPVDKTVVAIHGVDIPLGDRTNLAFLGTSVTYGRGSAVVVATGMTTELGRIADLIQDVAQEPTLLQKRLDKLAKLLAAVAVVIAVIVFLSGLIRGEETSLILLTAVSLAVAIVPEGLPAVLTFTLALGAQRMLVRRALVRRLAAVETLGSVTVICSDKTGTLTENRMTVTVLETPHGSFDLAAGKTPELNDDAHVLLAAAALCNDAVLDRRSGHPEAVGDPTEGALVIAADRFALRKEDLDSGLPRVGEVPFDSTRKRMTTMHGTPQGGSGVLDMLVTVADGAPLLAVVKGAGDGIPDLCNRIVHDGGIRLLDDAARRRLHSSIERMAENGLRVLAVAARGLTDVPSDGQAEEVERDLVLLGLVGMVDPPRSEARDAIARCATAGIRPIMITGDHPRTARAIAVDLGMAAPDSPTLTGRELEQMDSDALRAAVRITSVFARVSPEHKLRIVEALQANGEVVAMTGDGVNDAPALKKADIGVAMGSGTDVAKEAAEVVLLDDNFATIVAAVEEGRVVYDNVRRFVGFSISGNFAKVLIVAIPPLFGLPLYLLPIMILWSNLLTDGLLGLGMGVEKAERDTMRRPPYSPTESILSRGIGIQIAWLGPVIGVALIAVGWAVWNNSGGGGGSITPEAEALLATIVFTSLAFIQLARALASRSFVEPVWRTGLRGNRVLVGMILVALVLQLGVVYLPFAQDIFGTVPLSPAELAAGVLLALGLLGLMEADKALRRRAARMSQRTPG